MKRIIIHWTAGGHRPNATDRKHYHQIIAGDGTVTPGDFPIAANAGPLATGAYAAHTLNCNTGSIGVALAAMAGAQEKPFQAGAAPITTAQEKALTALLVKLCDQYQIPVTRETVLTHAEVQPTLGITQKSKWDITWLPGMTQPGSPLTVGDLIRQRVRDARAVTPDPVPDPFAAPDGLAALINLFARTFGGSK